MLASTSSGIFLGDVAQRLDLRMAEERIVIEGHLRVERKQLVILGGDERIDLQQRSIGFGKGLVQALEELHCGVDHGWLQPQGKSDLASLVVGESDDRINLFLVDRLGILGGDFFNLHTAGLRSHEDQLACCAVQHDAEIQLAIDRGCLFYQQALHLLPLRSGLVSHQLHSQDGLGCIFSGRQVAHHLHAAAFAAASGVNLRLDHDARSAAAQQQSSRIRGLRQRVCYLTPGHGHTVLRQDRLCLIFMNFHC